MPHLHHVALWVADLDRMAAFYARYLGADIGALYENPAKGFRSRFISLGEGARLELMTTSRLAPVAHAPGAERMGLTHLAVSVGGDARVDALAAELARDGHVIVDGPRCTGDGYYECVVLDPEGNRLELTA